MSVQMMNFGLDFVELWKFCNITNGMLMMNCENMDQSVWVDHILNDDLKTMGCYFFNMKGAMIIKKLG